NVDVAAEDGGRPETVRNCRPAASTGRGHGAPPGLSSSLVAGHPRRRGPAADVSPSPPPQHDGRPNLTGGMTGEAFAAALAGERVRTARLFNLLRFVGVSAFFALTILMGAVLKDPEWVANDWTLFTVYWVASGAVLWLGARSERVARWSGLGIPLLDMPAVFLLQSGALLGRANAGFIVGGSEAFYVLLIIGAMA